MRQPSVKTLFLLFISFSRIPLSAQVPPGTGAGEGARDTNFQIISETLSPHEVASPAAAWIVTKLGGWAPEFSGTHWIAPDADQSSSTRDGKYFGSVTYQTQFTATRGLTLNTRVLADDDVAVSLNGKTVFSSTGGQQYRFAAMFKMTGFASGMNTVVFTVSNSGGGPTGLDVAFADANAPPSGPPQLCVLPSIERLPEGSPLAANGAIASPLLTT